MTTSFKNLSSLSCKIKIPYHSLSRLLPMILNFSRFAFNFFNPIFEAFSKRLWG